MKEKLCWCMATSKRIWRFLMESRHAVIFMIVCRGRYSHRVPGEGVKYPVWHVAGLSFSGLPCKCRRHQKILTDSGRKAHEFDK